MDVLLSLRVDAAGGRRDRTSVSRCPGSSTVTEAASSTRAGPASDLAGAAASARSKTGIVCGAADEPDGAQLLRLRRALAAADLGSSGFAVRDTTVTVKLTISMISPGMVKPKRALCASWNAAHSCAVVAAAKRSMVDRQLELVVLAEIAHLERTVRPRCPAS